MTTVPPTAHRQFMVNPSFCVELPPTGNDRKPRVWLEGAVIHEGDFQGDLDKIEMFLTSGRIREFKPDVSPGDNAIETERRVEAARQPVPPAEPPTKAVDTRRNLDPRSLQHYLDTNDLNTLNAIMLQRVPNAAPMGNCQDVVDYLCEFYEEDNKQTPPDLGVDPATPLGS